MTAPDHFAEAHLNILRRRGNYATPVRQVRVYNGGMCPLVTVYLFRDVHFAPTGNTVVCVRERDIVETVLGGGRLEALFKGKAVYTPRGKTK
jgi:hypothetical protein